MSWVSELPEELKQRPAGLVVLTGFDTTYNAIHKHILDTFCNNRRPDRVPLNFVSLPADHEYPKPHGRRTTYEFYMPKGILKRTWLSKHLRRIPALVLLFFDLDWDDPLWRERQMECATRLQIIRASLQNRSTKIAVVLMQRVPPPPGEDDVAAERAVMFCSVCDLSPKALFVLPQTDHLLGFIQRLENAFYDIVQNYYATEARRVKAHAELLTKSMHQALFVRHQFKIAFFNELRQDIATALKHYKQAYSNLLEIAVTKSNATEIKGIAGLINYKICALSFTQNAPLDAVGQIRRHIDNFRNLEGLPELAFEHSAWMSTQFASFGDLFDLAIKQGLTALQTQHPGFYYHQAAYHAILRKQRSIGLMYHHDSSPQPLELDMDSSVYFGQRPYQALLQQRDGSEVAPDGDKEKRLLRQLQDSERLVDHSQTIISLLEAALMQFKKFKCSRMKTLLTVQMGEERYHAGEFGKALALLRPAALDYRLEKWFRLLTSVLTTALKCAYMTASVKDYVAIAVDMIGRDVVRSAETKKRIQMNLLKVLHGRPPDGESGLGIEHIEQAHALWLGAWSRDGVDASDGSTSDENKLSITLEPQLNRFACQVAMLYEGGLVECKACFAQAKTVITDLVQVHVYLRLSCHYPMSFNKLYLSFNNPAYDSQCILVDEPPSTPRTPLDGSLEDGCSAVGDLYLAPNVVKKITFTFHALREDVGKPVEIKALTLELGQQASAALKWTSASLCGPLVPYSHLDHGSVGPAGAMTSSDDAPLCVLPWHHIQPRIVTLIVPREGLIDIGTTFEGPCLKDEIFAIRYTVANKENCSISNLRVCLRSSSLVLPAETVLLGFSEDAVSEKHSPTCEIETLIPGDLNPGQQSSFVVYTRITTSGSVTLTSQVTYLYGAGSSSVACSGESRLSLDVVDALDVTSSIRSCKFSDLDFVISGEPFVVCTSIRNISPFTLELVSTALQQSKFFEHEESAPPVQCMRLAPSDVATECHYVVGQAAPSTVPLGSYLVSWKRASSAEVTPESTEAGAAALAKTRVLLPALSVQQPSLLLTASLPSHGVVRQNFTVTYTVRNCTEHALELEAAMDSSEVMVYAGHRQTRFRVLPNDSHDIVYSFFPLMTGLLPIPRLQLASTTGGGSAPVAATGSAGSLFAPSLDICRRMVPESIFVMPHPRG